MDNYESYTLKNGLRIVHMPLSSNVSYCGYIVNTGSRDEASDEFGMAHFVEHMLFKGTTNRHSYHIINRMESVGGDINAYTNKEETVIYSTFLEGDFERALDLLTDLTFRSVFPQREIDKEIDVILDEINSYEDSPSELIYDDFEDMVFAGSQLGHNILGLPEQLEKFDTKKIVEFVRRHYSPNNMVFFSLGKTNIKKVVRLAEKYLSEIEFVCPSETRIAPSLAKPKDLIVDRDTIQAHTLIGGRCYNLHDKQRKTLLLLSNILGGPGMNSRLNISLREKRGYVYNVESSMTNYSDTGIFTIYFGSDKKNAERCIQLIHKELKIFREIQLTSSQLNAAKKQIIGQIAIARDNHENLALSLGKSFLHHNHFSSIEETVKNIESISSIDVWNVANEILITDNLFQLIYE